MSESRTSHSSAELISRNRSLHDAVAPLYESNHPEIFNPTEQLRIKEVLRSLLAEFTAAGESPYVLDYGAGTGNLTRHLLDLGATVVSAEVSAGCLKELLRRLPHGSRCEPILVNGSDLKQFSSGTFDVVVTYSVLHHVPDYLSIVEEFVRVLKPGGVLSIDHEVCPSFWRKDANYQAYCLALERHQNKGPGVIKRVVGIFKKKGRWRYVLARLRRMWHHDADEGDIHVHPDDNIDWTAIRHRIEPWCGMIREEDYLICREQAFPAPVWEQWRGRCADIRLFVARKR